MSAIRMPVPRSSSRDHAASRTRVRVSGSPYGAAVLDTVSIYHSDCAQGSLALVRTRSNVHDKGPDQGPTEMRSGEKPQHLVDIQTPNHQMWWGVGTAYRIRTGDLRLERAVS